MEPAKRRSSFFPKSAGTPVHGSASQLAVLDLLYRYDCLPSSYIRAALPSHSYAQKVINLLNQEGYIGIFEASRDHFNARYRERIFEIRPKGLAMLGRKRRPGHDDHFKHKFMRSVIQFSFDLAPLVIPELRKHELSEILEHPSCPSATTVEKFPSHIPLPGSVLKPDADLFGYEYQGKAFMFFHGFEADRETEPLTTQGRRQNIRDKIRRYAQYLSARGYLTRYGLKTCTILFVTVSDAHVQAMLKIVEQECPPEIAPRFAFTAIPDFMDDRFPPPTPHLVTAPWRRAGAEPLSILETLKATAERKV
jgi:hypothetical protein